MVDTIAMFNRWAKSGLSAMFSRLSSSLGGSSSSSTEPTRNSTVDDFQRIMRMLPRIEEVLGDAEEMEIQDRSTSLRLSELRLLAYDIEDLVDEYEYEVLRAQMEARSAAEAYLRGTRKQKSDDHHDEDEWGEGNNLFESSSLQVPSIPDGMAKKLRKVLKKFDEIEKDREALRLTEEEGVRRSVATWSPPPTSSHVDETSIIGREGDKEKIMELLLSDSKPNDNFQVSNKITVIPIVGMGGVGKTTLAQCIYNDPRICQYFDLRILIYVSEDFDLLRLTKEIYSSITNQSCMEDAGFNHLQNLTRKELMKFKRVFLVLDDVWNEKQHLWESLQVSFHGVTIVNILMTTRHEKVANIMRTTKFFHLGILSEEEGLRLFRQRALCDDNSLMNIGQKIVRKCGGLPLAIKLLGSHLRFERDEDKWTSILDSKLWELDLGEKEIFPALKLSYQRMPNHLKPCFRYCSMFPKNCIPNKNRLVWLWMAQGYIQSKQDGKTIEETGREYFDELLGRSLLQPTKSNNFFEMHDFIFELALSISREEFKTVTLKSNKEIHSVSNNVRHLALYDQNRHNSTSLYRFLRRHTALRSIFYYCHTIVNCFQLSDSMHLRILHINFKHHYPNTLKFLGSVASLKHLRYLSMGDSTSRYWNYGDAPLNTLNSFHGMYNIQVLDLFGCNRPIILPASINNLINLRHLILPYHSFMPCGIIKSTSLQTLKYVIVKEESQDCGGLSVIEDLESLTKSCRISNICFAKDVWGIQKANINKKKHIWKLCLDWFDETYISPYDVDISIDRANGKRSELAEIMLEALRPHNDLKELEIHDYPGIRFPLWLGDPSYSKLRDIALCRCNKWDGSCSVLERDLPCLQSISIIDCATLKFIKIVQSSMLKNLLVKDCPKLSTLHGLYNLCMLEKLEIRSCYSLLISVEEILPSKLQSVCFEDCWKVTSITGLQNLHSLEKLHLERCWKLQLSLDEQLSIMPDIVKVIDCPSLKDWCQKYGFEFIQVLPTLETWTTAFSTSNFLKSANLVSLKTLYISNSYESDLLENEWFPSNLNNLHITSCPLLKLFFPYQNLSALRLLKIWNCKAVTYLSGLQILESLEKLEIIECPQFILSPVQRFPSKLQYLLISNCPRLMWLPGLQQLSSLKDLKLYECRELMLLPLEQLLPLMHQVQLEIINCPKLERWCRRYNLSYNKKESPPKALFASSSREVNLWLEEEQSTLYENICVLNYDEATLKTEKWPAFRLLGFYICSSVHLKSIKFSPNFTRLKQLRIWNCSHLQVLYEFNNLISLQDLDISNCPNLLYLGHPHRARRIPSVRFLKVSKCLNIRINNESLWDTSRRIPSVRFLKVSKCPNIRINNEWFPYPTTDVEIRACPQLQEWCQKHHFAYFQD